jgi:hypothetical protein
VTPAQLVQLAQLVYKVQLALMENLHLKAQKRVALQVLKRNGLHH